jgi:hypothetical protein
VQCSSDSRIQEATSAKVFIIIVICVVAVISIANKSGIQSEPSSSYQSHYPSVARDNIISRKVDDFIPDEILGLLN